MNAGSQPINNPLISWVFHPVEELGPSFAQISSGASMELGSASRQAGTRAVFAVDGGARVEGADPPRVAFFPLKGFHWI